jgi:poly(3-hydroxybutyrate) depolymerase
MRAGARAALAAALVACRAAAAAPSPTAPDDIDAARAAAVKAIAAAKARLGGAATLAREVSLPSIERLVEDADQRRAKITNPERDLGFVRKNLATARAYAERLGAGDDPYKTATGMIVKAYRADWDGTLQPYALYVPPGYKPGRPGGWPLVVTLHGAFSDHRHNLRRTFGLDNRPGETDAEASRNELPLPDVPALVVSPLGRGELMSYDGLGGEDVMRVIADVRRAYDVDPARITLTGLSMGGGATWQIGLRHPELFAALAPVCAFADFARLVQPGDRPLYDLDALERLSPRAIADRAARMQVFIFHGAKDPIVPVNDARQMVDRFRSLGFLDKNVHYTEYPGVGHEAWKGAYKDAALLRKLASIAHDPAAPPPPADPPPGQAIPGLISKSVPRQRPHLYVYGTSGAPEAVAAARALATRLADWGPMVNARFAVKADREVTADDRARFNLVLVGAAPLNTLAAELDIPQLAADRAALGDRAFRAVVPDTKAPSRFALVLGALTPKGFDRLKRFAHTNRDVWVPEPNRPFVMLSASAPP